MNCAFDLIDFKVCNIYKVNVLKVMRALKHFWNSFPYSIMSSCWIHARLIQADATASIMERDQTMAADKKALLLNQVQQLVPQRTCLSIAELLNSSGEEDSAAGLADEELVAYVLPWQKPDSNDEDTGEMASQLLPISEQLNAIAISKRIVDAQGESDDML